MKPALFLRVASVLTLIHAVLHTIGGVFGAPLPGAQQAAVSAMKSNQFPVMGLTRSYWMFYSGLGLVVSVVLTVEAVVFWQLSSLSKSDSNRLRPIYASFMVGYLMFAVVSFKYFFVPPAIFELVIALCLGMAILTTRSSTPNHI